MTQAQTLSMLAEDGFPLFVMTVDDLQSHCVELTVREVGGWEEGDPNKPTFDDGNGNAVEQEKALVYLRVLIKWDGCSHVYFGGSPGYLHLCGSFNWKKHVKLMEWIYKEAEKLLPQLKDEDPWE